MVGPLLRLTPYKALNKSTGVLGGRKDGFLYFPKRLIITFRAEVNVFFYKNGLIFISQHSVKIKIVQVTGPPKINNIEFIG